MNDIEEQIKKNYTLVKRIEGILSEIEIPDDKQKALLFTAFLKNGLSHFYSINILIENKLYHSAFALVRVFFDNTLRGEYSIYILYDSEINDMFIKPDDWDFPNTTKICKKLDKFFDNTFFDIIRIASYGKMCDFTHTSNNQIARHFKEDKSLIESNFSEDEILDLLNGNYTLMERFARNYIAFIKDSDLLKDGVNL